MDLWLQTLDEYLTQQSAGLEHARVRVELATYFMERKQWDKAIPYAEAAAETYAEWAMICAVHCYQGKGDLARADAWFARIVERYPGHELEYAKWRRFYKVIDEQQAAAEVLEQIRRAAERLPVDKQHAIGGQYLASGFSEEALGAFRKVYDAVEAPGTKFYNGFFVVVLADQLGQHKLRDEVLAALAALGPPTRQRQLAVLMQEALRDGGTFDVQKLDQFLRDAIVEDRVNLSYFTGRFLLGRQRDTALAYLRQAASLDEAQTYMTHVLARFALREAGEAADTGSSNN
jgi:tetratricopeptide (TPR) repeat protein